MATFNRYAGRSDYFVRDAFRTNGKISNVTYQITPKGLDVLLNENVPDGGKIPDDLFRKLKNSDDLYTGNSGATTTDDRPSSENKGPKIFSMSLRKKELIAGGLSKKDAQKKVDTEASAFRLKSRLRQEPISHQRANKVFPLSDKNSIIRPKQPTAVIARLNDKSASCKHCTKIILNEPEILLRHLQEDHSRLFLELTQSQFTYDDGQYR